MGHYIEVETGVNLYVEDLNKEGKETIVFFCMDGQEVISFLSISLTI